MIIKSIAVFILTSLVTPAIALQSSSDKTEVMSATATAEKEFDPDKPGEIAKLVSDKTAALGKLEFAERVKQIAELKVALEKEEKAGKDEAISFIVALGPLFERVKELQDKKACSETRSQMLFLWESGTAYDGKLPYFVPESLKVLDAVCGEKI